MRAMFFWLAVFCMFVASAHAEIRVEFAMDHDPDATPPKSVTNFPENLLSLWLKALARPEAEMQRMAAESIAQAQAFQLPDIETSKPALLKVVTAESSHSAARLAAARALIVLDARDTAAGLFEASQRHGTDLRQLVEPALAKWKFEPIRSVWLKRLNSPSTHLRDLMLAIRGLREVGDGACVEALLKITHDSLRPVAARLEAARSVGSLRDSGLEEDALRFSGKKSAAIFDRLCAAALLDRHRSDSARAALSQLTQDAEPSVAVAALASLNAQDPGLVVPLAEQAMRNDDANVRRQGVFAFAERPSPERVTALARLLDDSHPSVRETVRESLFRLAQTAELDSPIRKSATAVLNGDGWRGQEQAALLLTALDHKPIAGRLVELLESPRDEVLIAAAWGLRLLAVPETLAAILDKATRQTAARKRAPPHPAVDVQVALMFETLGLMKYAPGEELLRLYVPKDPQMGDLSRGAAVWGLGKFHADKPDEGLAKQFFDRLTDPGIEPPETERVRIMSVIAMGTMKAKSQVEPLRATVYATVAPIREYMAMRWTMQALTGEKLPEPPPAIVTQYGWFLEPLERPASDEKPSAATPLTVKPNDPK